MRMMRVAAIALVCALVATACGTRGARYPDDNTLLVWSMEVQPDRIEATERVFARFTERTGISVDLVPVEDAQVGQLLASAALAGEMPDVITALPLGLAWSFAEDEFLDTAASTRVIDSLGPKTWTDSSLALTRRGQEQIVVPSDGYPMLLAYRTDLFREAGLVAPTDYAKVRTAAERLTGGGRFGISIATDASDAFTQQTFEMLALGNDCQLVDDAGAVTLDSPQCAATIELYDQLGRDFSPPGTQSVDSTRASYFAGQSGMILWSSFLLDELAGLRDDAMPSCPECEERTWLARNTGIVPLVSGPDAAGDAAPYGEVTSWAITSQASSADAEELVRFMLTDGYAGWLDMAPEGKVPVRLGEPDDPRRYLDAWADLPAGVDTELPLREVYPPEVIDQLVTGSSELDRWALAQGRGDVLGPLSAELPISRVIADMTSGAIGPAEAQQQMQESVVEMAER